MEIAWVGWILMAVPLLDSFVVEGHDREAVLLQLAGGEGLLLVVVQFGQA